MTKKYLQLKPFCIKRQRMEKVTITLFKIATNADQFKGNFDARLMFSKLSNISFSFQSEIISTFWLIIC